MTAWTLTKGLQTLRGQVNAAFPSRDKTSDGTIGDTAHQAETSGHNPDSTPGSKAEWQDGDSKAEVRAWDMDSDLRDPDVTAQQLVDHIRRLHGLASVIRYMIYNRRMYHVDNGFAPTAYTGPSPHTEHVHFSGARSQAADENTSFDYHLEDLVALTEEQTRTVIREELAAWAKRDPLATMFARSDEQRDRMSALMAKDPVDEQALAADLAAAVRAALPEGTAVTGEQLQQAVLGALRELSRPAA